MPAATRPQCRSTSADDPNHWREPVLGTYTIRLGSFEETEWILLDLRPHFAAGGYGHGVAQVWSENSHLLAAASQTA